MNQDSIVKCIGRYHLGCGYESLESKASGLPTGVLPRYINLVPINRVAPAPQISENEIRAIDEANSGGWICLSCFPILNSSYDFVSTYAPLQDS